MKIQDVYKVPSQCNIQNRSYSNQDEDDQLPSTVNLPEQDLPESIPEPEPTSGTECNTSASLQLQDRDIFEEIAYPPCDNDLGMANTPEMSSEAATKVSRRNPPRERRTPGYLADYRLS